MSQYFRTEPIPSGRAGVELALQRIHELFEDEKSVALLAAENHAPAIQADAPLRSDEPCLILTTSGSTGSPRGVEIPVSALASAAENSAIYFHSQAVWLTALPVTSMGGLNTVIRSALAGTSPVIWDGVAGFHSFDAEAFIPYLEATVASARKQKLAAATSLVPAQLARLLNHDAARAALASLDYVLVGGGAVASELIHIAATSDVNLIRTYGSTETCGGVVYNGEPLDGVTIEITSDSGVVVHSDTLAHSYRDGQPIAATGWQSNDVGEMRDGRLKIHGRRDDLIKVGGHLINLQRIESAVTRLVGSAEVAVSSIADVEYGHVPVIVIAAVFSDLQLSETLRTELELPRIPLRIQRVSEIPRLLNGKPDRLAISQLGSTDDNSK